MSVAENIKNGVYVPKLDYKEDRMAYRLFYTDLYRLERTVFEADLAEEFSFTDHPKRDKLFSLAWSHGHSSSLSEVLMYYEEFSELLS